MRLFRRGKAPRDSRDAASPLPAVVATLPRVGEAGDLTYAFTTELPVLTAMASKVAAALRETALEILAQHVGQGRRSLAFCGVTRGVGVSFVSANLAAALAIDGVATLLIDTDLEHPSLEHFIRPSSPTAGLRHFLASADVSRDDIVHRDVIPNLSLIYAGGATDRASDLVGNSRFADLVRHSMRDYDLVVMDTPPASLTADTRHIAAVAHYVMIVARAGATHVDGVEVLSQSLLDDGVEIAGSVLNAA